MYVCICAGVTERELYCRLQQGIVDLQALRAELGLCQGCGKCIHVVQEVLKHCAHAQRGPLESYQSEVSVHASHRT